VFLIQGCFRKEASLIRGLMSDEEWACFAPFVTNRGAHSGRRPKDHRLVLDGIFWLARTGAQWRDLHEHFGKWSSVYRQFRRWTLAGLWELLLEALNATRGLARAMCSQPIVAATARRTAG
jgi:transposase